MKLITKLFAFLLFITSYQSFAQAKPKSIAVVKTTVSKTDTIYQQINLEAIIATDWNTFSVGTDAASYSQVVHMSPDGTVYAILKTKNWQGDLEKHVSIGKDNKWETDFEHAVSDVLINSKEQVFVTTYSSGGNTLLQKTESGWKEMHKTSKGIYLGKDDQFYLVALNGYGYDKPKTYSFYQLAGTEEKKLNADIQFIEGAKTWIDKKGQLYIYGNEVYNGDFFLKKWSGTEWATILKFTKGHEEQIPRDSEGNIHWLFADEKYGYYKIWDGSTWIEKSFDHKIPTAAKLNFINDRWTYMVEGSTKEEKRIYEFVNGKWQLLTKFTAPKEKMDLITYCLFIASTKKLYSVIGDDLVVAENKVLVPERTVTKKIYPVPVETGISLNDEAKKYYRNYKLFDLEGKLGLEDSTGKMIAYPVFDKIMVTSAPQDAQYRGYDVRGYAFYLRQNNTDFLAKYYISSLGWMDGFEYSETTCRKCRGQGQIAAHTETQKIAGDWVAPTTHTSSRPSTMGGNIITITTTPGYYKEASYITVNIPAGACDACNGKGKFKTSGNFKYSDEKKEYLPVTSNR